MNAIAYQRNDDYFEIGSKIPVTCFIPGMRILPSKFPGKSCIAINKIFIERKKCKSFKNSMLFERYNFMFSYFL